MEDKRDLENDLKILTIIPWEPGDPVDLVRNVVAPHALRRAIAAEAALAEAQQTIINLQDLLTESENEAEKYQVEASTFEERFSLLSASYKDLDASARDTLEMVYETARSLKEAQQTIANLRAERDGLKEHRSALVIGNTEIQGKLQQTEKERERYTSMAVRLNEEKGWLEKDLTKAEKIIARQWAALTQIEEALSDDTTVRAQRINAIIAASIEEGSTQSCSN